VKIESVKVIPSPVEVIFTEEKEVVKQKMDEIYEQNKEQLQKRQIRGFREGRVPRHIIEDNIGINNLYGKILDEAYSKMLDEFDQNVVGLIRINVLNKNGDIPEYEDLKMIAIVDVEPKCSVKKTEFSLKKIQPEIKDEELEARINMEINSKSRLETIEEDRTPQKSDILIIDFEGSLNGKVAKEACAENFQYTVGKTKFVDGFEEVLMEMKAGETKEAKIKFPNDYPNQKFQGRKVVFKITLMDINKNYVPTIEEAAEAEQKTVEEYKNAIKERLLKLKEQASENDLEEQISNQVIENCEFAPIPESMVLKELKNDNKIENEFRNLVEANKDKIDEITGKKIGNLNDTELNRYRQSIYSKYRDSKERNVKIDLATEQFCKKFKIKILKRDITAFFDDAISNGYFTPEKSEELKKRMETDKYFKKYIEYGILNKKLILHIKEKFCE